MTQPLTRRSVLVASAASTLLGALGAEMMAVAIVRAVRAATRLNGPGLPDLPAAGDL